MAVGLGPHARHRLGVGRADGPRRRLAAHPDDRRARPRGRALPSVGCCSTASTTSQHLGARLAPDGTDATRASPIASSTGPGALRFLVSADDGNALSSAVLHGASRRLGKRDRPPARARRTSRCSSLPPEEQYLVATGRTYFRDLAFDQLRRLQFDLETTGLDPRRDRIFMIAVRDPSGRRRVLEATSDGDAGEADLIRRLVERSSRADPDVIENHNLHGFDLPFLDRRARTLGVPLALGRIGPAGLRQRAARGAASRAATTAAGAFGFVAPGRELIDTLDAVLPLRLRDARAARPRPQGGRAAPRHRGGRIAS